MYVPSPKRPLVEGVGVGVGAAGVGLGLAAVGVAAVGVAAVGVAAVGVGVAAVGAGLGVGVAAAGVGLAAFGVALAAVAVGLGVGRGADVVAFGAGVGEGVAGMACAAAAAGSPGAASSESVEGATKTPMIMRTHRAPAPAAAAVCHLGAPARQSHQAAAGQIARLVTTFLVRARPRREPPHQEETDREGQHQGHANDPALPIPPCHSPLPVHAIWALRPAC